MGERIRALASGAECEVVLAIDAKAAPGVTTDRSRIAAGCADVAIDFSLPAGTAAILPLVRAARIPLVVGTTGHDEAGLAALDAAAKVIGVLVSSNMSLGVNLLFALARAASKTLRPAGFEVEVVESHHKRKMDAPSGTAVSLVAALGGDVPTHSLRMGGIVGEHAAHFASEEEEILLSHRALSRDVFARGALRAARWLAGRPAGRYEMKDVLGL